MRVWFAACELDVAAAVRQSWQMDSMVTDASVSATLEALLVRATVDLP